MDFYGCVPENQTWPCKILANPTMWVPPDISWFIKPIYYSNKYHKRKVLGVMFANLVILGAPHCSLGSECIMFLPTKITNHTSSKVFDHGTYKIY